MAKRGGFSLWILAIVLGVGLQAIFICADGKQSAARTAINFSKAYFSLDKNMDKYLCDALRTQDEGALIENYIHAKTEDTRLRGFDIGMAKRTLTHINAQTLSNDGTQAIIRVKGANRTCINPIFAYVARLFQIGETHHFEETLHLIKENGCWKISGAPYGIAMDV